VVIGVESVKGDAGYSRIGRLQNERVEVHVLAKQLRLRYWWSLEDVCFRCTISLVILRAAQGGDVPNRGRSIVSYT
jgi:hypothetical protein